MTTAVENTHNTEQIDPLPMNYKALKDMKETDYSEHLNKRIVSNNFAKNVEYNVQCIIPSLNMDEMNTVTLLFYQTDNDSNAEAIHYILAYHVSWASQHYNFYTADCCIENIDNIRGILITIRSVENKNGHRHDEVMQTIDTIREHLKKLIDDPTNAELKPLYEKIMKKTVLIQVSRL